MFVNYISHEARTPLNTAKMGVEYLLQEYSYNNKSIDNNAFTNDDLKDTLVEIAMSCDIAINTLNEVIIFDKLGTRQLIIEKTRFHVLSFVADCITQFKLIVSILYMNIDYTYYIHSLIYIKNQIIIFLFTLLLLGNKEWSEFECVCRF
jgi:signal transduction histidine kinase